ncbi:SDR family oxidoreductase [Alkalihalobacillus sp. TS-13]|uniref:SDR family oxidoreductase n=1 Tax=Alkalihalobacillus sp. TS-13 TaxID=2842455 RepID=UPI001C873597|nr:SDR family oxidoreductase [Alkalihalobacillus sp. TS-13]
MSGEKVAFITGAGRGIGAATAKELASMGIKVAINYLSDHKSADQVVNEIRSDGGDAIKIQGDVCSAEQVTIMTNQILEQWGRIDILVSNANIPFVIKPFLTISWSEFSQKLNDEIKAAYHLSQAILPVMKENSYGRIVYIGSAAAKIPEKNFIAHGTAKAALVQFAKQIAKEFGEFGITANVISPGLVETDASREQVKLLKSEFTALTPLKRIAQPEDVAKAVALYVCDRSGFITGSYIPVDGGMYMI